MDHDELRSMIPAYALGAVPDAEIGPIRDHILSCDECMAEADRYAAVTSSIALAVEPAPLPRGFEERVLDQVRTEQRSEPALLHPRVRWWSRWSVAGAAAGLSAALILGLLFVDARMDAQRRLEVVAAVLQDEGLELRGEETVGKVTELPDGSAVFAVSGLGEAPTGKTYVLWSMKGESCPSTDPESCLIEPAGTFDVTDGVGIVELDGSISEWDQSAVTIEDEGAEFPTTDPVASTF